MGTNSPDAMYPLFSISKRKPSAHITGPEFNLSIKFLFLLLIFTLLFSALTKVGRTIRLNAQFLIEINFKKKPPAKAVA